MTVLVGLGCLLIGVAIGYLMANVVACGRIEDILAELDEGGERE